ncbi:GntR family transcriptional regulator [Poriferisphaera sp. WC338]|uniref:GntR family transcriptional regulator n=1 Tax=Poriferisphaera sp. WC338 TaxID=3425129 RepID=UPI003D81B96E
MNASAATEHPPKLRDQAYAYICQQFTEGKLKVGSHLSIGALAKEMGISRTPVSEALLRMQIENKVEQVPRIGTIVRQPSVKEVVELYQMRELVEGHAAAHAAKTFGDAEIKLLDSILAQFRELCVLVRNEDHPELSLEEIQQYLAVDVAFHAAILRGTDNRWMRKAIEDAQAFLLICCSKHHVEYAFKRMASIYRSHGRIRNAIRRGDAEAAEALMKEHIHLGCEGAIKYLTDHKNVEEYLDVDLASFMPQGFDSLGKRKPNLK